MKKLTIGLIVLVFIIISACNKNNSTTDDNSPAPVAYLDLSDTAGKYFTGFYSEQIDQKAVLGRVLFYDKNLSINNSISCGSCHLQAHAFADNVALSRGFEGRLTSRNTPAIQNMFGSRSVQNFEVDELNTLALFWDGREKNMKTMVLRPISNHVEMGMTDLEELTIKLNKLEYYKGLVEDAYNTPVITEDIIADAMSYFMFAIRSNNSRLDRHLNTQNELTALELRGQELFNIKYNCGSCHVPPMHYNGGLQTASNIGLDETTTDKGMGAILITEPDMDGVFKTPNFQNIALTAPYMHDGRFNTLEEVLDHYSEGIQNHPNLDTRLKDEDGDPMKMDITENDKRAIIAFLHTMTDYDMITNPKYSNPFKTK